MRRWGCLRVGGKTREEFRKVVVLKFLKELPGKGKADLCSFYVYEVENLSDENKIEIRRPALLNKGFDFTVHVPGINFGHKKFTDRPSHDYILADLKEKRSKSPRKYRRLIFLIAKIYECQSISRSQIVNLQFKTGLPVEMILKIIKWLFIEQDVTYWNWSGREMFYSKILSIDNE